MSDQGLWMTFSRCGVAMAIVMVAAAAQGAPLNDRNTALVDAVAGAFTPAQMAELVNAAATKIDTGGSLAMESLERLPQLLGVSVDAVLGLLRIPDWRDIESRQLARTLVQAVADYHAVMDRLAEFILDNPGADDLVKQAQAAMFAGRFDDAEALLRQIEDRE